MEQTLTKTTYQKYPRYKDSEVDWLGEIPESWTLLSNKHIFKLKKNLVGKRSSEYTLLSLTLNGIIVRDLEGGGKFPAEFDTYQEVKKDDFVFCLFDVEETPRCVGLSDHQGMITGAYTVLECNSKFENRFLYYFYLNLDSDKRMSPLYTGLRNTISKDNFFAFKTFVPPLPEQTAIANFLDEKTTKIDQAIAQKEKMIALLKERKQIVIQNAVTKGLDPNVKMKDSGVDWLGEIPEGWNVKPLFSEVKLRSEDNHIDEELLSVYLDKGVIRFKDVVAKRTNVTSTDLSKYQLVEIGDFVLNNQQAWRGSVGVSSFRGIVSPAYLVLQLSKRLDKKFANYMFRNQHMVTQYLKSSKGVGTIQRNLYYPQLKRANVLLPPLPEQTAIANFIESKSSQIDNIINLQQTQIKKLKEYKSTLIDSAVTGKIKVTDYGK